MSETGHEFSLTHDIDLQATPEQVWAAIATGPGIDSWFMGRNEVEAGVADGVAPALPRDRQQQGHERPEQQPGRGRTGQGAAHRPQTATRAGRSRGRRPRAPGDAYRL